MRIGYVRDENGKLVRTWVSEGKENNPEFLFYVGAQFGDCVWVDEDHIEEAKTGLLEQMFDAIRNLAKNDEFWIVRNPSYWDTLCVADALIDPLPQPVKEGKTSVAWTIGFPQIEGYFNWEDAERLNKMMDACFSK